MGYWFCMLVIVLIIPILMIVFGQYFYKNGAPENINTLFGYRTQRSKQTWDTWTFAHRELAKLWKLIGLILIPVSAGVFALTIKRTVDEISIYAILIMLLQVIAIVVSIFLIEGKLKKNFNERGERTEESLAAEEAALAAKEQKEAAKAEKKGKKEKKSE